MITLHQLAVCTKFEVQRTGDQDTYRVWTPGEWQMEYQNGHQRGADGQEDQKIRWMDGCVII